MFRQFAELIARLVVPEIVKLIEKELAKLEAELNSPQPVGP